MTLPFKAERLEAPTFFPYCCEICQSQKGPVFDTQVDRPAMGGHVRVMICRSCIRGLAIDAGYVKGPEAERLEKASDTVAQAEIDLVDLRDLVAKADKALRESDAKQELLTSELERLRGENEQLRFKAQQLRDGAAELIAS